MLQCVLEFNFAPIKGPVAFTFLRKRSKSLYPIRCLLPVICCISSQTKCSGYIASITYGLSRIVTSYLGITEPNQVVSHYTATRSFPKHDSY